MYLEISNVAAALGKNPYESKEKTLLISWARHCPEQVKKYLIENKCIIPLQKNEETFSDLQSKTYSSIVPLEYDVNDFEKIEKQVIDEYKRKRNNEQTESEIKQLKLLTKDNLKKDNGNIQENNIINVEKYIKGNDKMYYYTISSNACIGGKNDASIGEILLEIKTRTKKSNVRRNEYDLYQLICYLLATENTKGKIVQLFNKEKFDSDIATEKEYGIIDIKQEPWKDLCMEIIQGLKEYFDELSKLIKTSKFMYLSNVIPKKIRPIAKFLLKEEEKEEKEKKERNKEQIFILCEENIKFKNLFRHILN